MVSAGVSIITPVGRQRLEHYVVRRLTAEVARDGAHQLQPRCRQMDGDAP